MPTHSANPPTSGQSSYAYLGDGNPDTRGPAMSTIISTISRRPARAATIAFSDSERECLVRAVSTSPTGSQAPVPITVSVGYYYLKTDRTSSRYQFQYFRPDGALPLTVAQERPYFPPPISTSTPITSSCVTSPAKPVPQPMMKLTSTVHAGYAQVEAEITDNLRATAGVRYEEASKTSSRRSNARADQDRQQLLAARRDRDVEFGGHAASPACVQDHRPPPVPRTRAQIYQDFESDREFSGNPFLGTDAVQLRSPLRIVFRAGPAPVARRLLQEDRQSDRGGRLFRERRPASRRLRQRSRGRAVWRRVGGAGLSAACGPRRQFFDSRRLLFIGNYTYTRSRITADAA